MKKCLRCGEKNGDEYTYCGLCGALLPEIEAACLYGEGVDEKDENIAESPSEVSLYEMETFVGKNSGEIVEKFKALQSRGKKTVFYPILLLIGIFFGLPGVALWFLYRKMVKPAALLLVGSFLMRMTLLVFTFDFAEISFELLLVLLQNIFRTELGAGEYLPLIYSVISFLSVGRAPFAFAKYLITASGSVFLSLLAISVYKRHSMRRIFELKSAAPDKESYIKALRIHGGTSVSYALAGALCYIAALLLPWFIYTVYLFLR